MGLIFSLLFSWRARKSAHNRGAHNLVTTPPLFSHGAPSYLTSIGRVMAITDGQRALAAFGVYAFTASGLMALAVFIAGRLLAVISFSPLTWLGVLGMPGLFLCSMRARSAGHDLQGDAF